MSGNKPVGGGGRRHPNSLANLRAGNLPAPPANNQRAVTHGVYSRTLVADVSDEVRELMEALGETAPVRAADGSLPAADLIAVERAARLLRRYRRIELWLDTFGELDERTGNPKPATRLAEELGAALDRALDVLGMNPRSRSKLGLDHARTVSVAQAMSEPDPELRRRHYRELGLIDDPAEEDR